GGYAHNVGDIGRLQQVRAADAMLAAAENEGGGVMGDAMGMGMGIAMAGQMANQFGNATGQGQGQGQGQGAAAAPPPLPGQALFHVEVDGQATGPYSVQQLQAGVAAGQVNAATLVWSNGMAEWKQASQVPALAPLFATPPPPPPPTSNG